MSNHILITGATKGIGRACAEQFAALGWKVTAVARSTGDLEDMRKQWQQRFPQSDLSAVPADLALETEIELIPAASYDVILLNAASFSPGALLGETDVFREIFDLNVLGNHRLARRLLPDMIAKGGGHLIVIGSTGTDHWKSHMTAYVATKYALRGLFLGWKKDLEGTGVLATLVAPGATLTASWANETPPPDILQPEEVAQVVREAYTQKRTGRITVTPPR